MLGDSNAYPTIAVSDMEAAKAFYSNILGLEQVHESPGGVAYKSGNTQVFIYPSQYAGTNQATYAGWSAKDINSVVEGLKAKGVRFEHYENMPDTTLEDR